MYILISDKVIKIHIGTHKYINHLTNPLNILPYSQD
jgi:hypothetical protein